MHNLAMAKTPFPKHLKALIEEKGVSQAEVSRRLGTTQPYVCLLCNGHKPPPRPDLMAKLADALGLTGKDRQELMSYAYERAFGREAPTFVKAKRLDELFIPPKGIAMVPVLKTCPKLKRGWNYDLVSDWLFLPERSVGKRRIFALKAKGDEMTRAGVDHDDLLLIDADGKPENGKIIVFLNEKDDYQIRRFYRKGEKIVLAPDSPNQAYQPIIYNSETKLKLRGVVESIHNKRLS